MTNRRLFTDVGGLGVTITVVLVFIFAAIPRGSDEGTGAGSDATISTIGTEATTGTEGQGAEPAIGSDLASTSGGIEGTSTSPSGGPTEGIKVHGRWTIDVLDPDGTLVSL